MIMRLFVYGALGCSLEVFWTGLGSLFAGDWMLFGFTYLWMYPIYCLAIFMEPLHDKIRDLSWYIRGCIWTLIIFSIEYISGAMLCMLLGRCPWDYGILAPYTLNGLIRLDFAPAWFVMGLLFEKVHLALDKILERHLAS